MKKIVLKSLVFLMLVSPFYIYADNYSYQSSESLMNYTDEFLYTSFVDEIFNKFRLRLNSLSLVARSKTIDNIIGRVDLLKKGKLSVEKRFILNYLISLLNRENANIDLLNSLEVNKEKWISKGIKNYSFSYKIGGGLMTQDMIKKYTYNSIVKDGQKFSLTDYDGKSVDNIFYTIEDAFGYINDLSKENYYSIKIEYDVQYGYPKSIYIDRSSLVADEEKYIYIEGFKIN